MKTHLPITILLFTALLFCACSSDDENYNRVEIGETIPEFPGLEGFYGDETVSVSSPDFAGKRGLIVFFSTGCGDCQAQLPAINEVWSLVKDDPTVQMAAISRQSGSETPGKVATYWSDNSFSMPYYLDHGRAVFDMFAVQGVPRIYISDKDRVIREIFVETRDMTARKIYDLINKY